MSPVPSAQPSLSAVTDFDLLPGDAAKIKVLQVSKPVSEREMLFWLCARRLDRRPKQPLAFPDRRIEEADPRRLGRGRYGPVSETLPPGTTRSTR
jgi:hypothetical protein